MQTHDNGDDAGYLHPGSYSGGEVEKLLVQSMSNDHEGGNPKEDQCDEQEAMASPDKR